MAQRPQIKYAVHKSGETGCFLLGFDNLTKAEAAEYLTLLDKHQRARGEQRSTVEHLGMTTEEVAAALGVDAFSKAAAVTGGPRFVTKPAHFDHKYEPGAFGVCKRCGGEKH